MDTIDEKDSIRSEVNLEKKKKVKKKGAWKKRMEMNALKKKVEEKKPMEKKEGEVEFTFVLCPPIVFKLQKIGAILKAFTNIGLKLLDLRLMSVTRKFLEAHLEKEGRNFRDLHPGGGPFLAMKLGGDNAVKKACELATDKDKFPLRDFWPVVYSSATVEKALEDAATWFCDDSPNPLGKAKNGKRMIFNLPDHGICGGLPVKILESIVKYSRISFSLLSSTSQRFLLIKPKAFEKGVIPDLLSIIEKNCLYIKGLKLLKKSEVPDSVAWSDDNFSSSGEIQGEEFGIALICFLPDPIFDTEGSLIIGKDIIGDHVSSEFVFVSAEAESLKFVKEFFKFGVVGWLEPDPYIPAVHGGYFESTLIGLQFEDLDDEDMATLVSQLVHPDDPALTEFRGGS